MPITYTINDVFMIDYSKSGYSSLPKEEPRGLKCLHFSLTILEDLSCLRGSVKNKYFDVYEVYDPLTVCSFNNILKHFLYTSHQHILKNFLVCVVQSKDEFNWWNIDSTAEF